MLHWEFLHPNMTEYLLGHIGRALSENNPKTAAEQITALYPFGGWNPTFSSKLNNIRHLGDGIMKYPGDPPQRPIARAKLRDETICIYNSEFWAIFQPDGSFEMCRLD